MKPENVIYPLKNIKDVKVILLPPYYGTIKNESPYVGTVAATI